MIEYKWTITNLECQPVDNAIINYVSTVYWRLNGTDGLNYGSQIGKVDFEFTPTNVNYIPYNDLTEDEIIGWVQMALGFDGITGFETFIANVINLQNTAVDISTSLPWSS